MRTLPDIIQQYNEQYAMLVAQSPQELEEPFPFMDDIVLLELEWEAGERGMKFVQQDTVWDVLPMTKGEVELHRRISESDTQGLWEDVCLLSENDEEQQPKLSGS